ncbi:MAG: hypothetical protein JRF59_13345 [Deltaproteobacteria bacterium]|nr:hypothetical protein [Deltaproteobacteria bacterium]MBW1925072.1 hypothetical protein [Deltaproteobacteria bacterium]MBW2008703.1 hypothetical protein [Deltaproteobacteria bacterium]MBW2102574.1 hypothetical protein [Deltaproteobacteria bacterium]MBW2348805.1 hypothetical protein [Deltaproteobacteria bacterium]
MTKKQKMFEYNFFKNADHYEKWETVDFDQVYEMERTFTVEVEDIRNYSEGILDDNPLFNDEEAAAGGPGEDRYCGSGLPVDLYGFRKSESR